MTDSQKSQSKALRILKGIYDQTRDGGDPIFVAELAEAAGLTEPESEAAWRYLKDRGLIETFNLHYTARINAAGIHAIEDAQKPPGPADPCFPLCDVQYREQYDEYWDGYKLYGAASRPPRDSESDRHL